MPSQHLTVTVILIAVTTIPNPPTNYDISDKLHMSQYDLFHPNAFFAGKVYEYYRLLYID